MRHLRLAALAIAFLPTIAMAGGHSRFNLSLGFGNGFGFGFRDHHTRVDVGFRGDYVAYPQYDYAGPVYCDPPIVVAPAPVYCPPPVVYVDPAPRVYYREYYTPRYYAPARYSYPSAGYYYSR
jgi:hypothetical protein